MRGRITASRALPVSLLALLVIVLSSGPAGAVTQYTVTDLGTLGGATSDARGINASGQVVGTADTAGGGFHAFLWDGGVMYDLGTLGGTYSRALGVNDSGQVVGSSMPDGSWDYHAFLWDGGVMDDLGTLGGDSRGAAAINALGQVVGYSELESGNYWEWHAFVWESGTMDDLGTPGGDYNCTRANGINDSGQVVGKAEISSGHGTEALLWDGGVMHFLPNLGGATHSANDINASGRIVGSSETASWITRAVLWEGGAVYNLGTLGGDTAVASGINTFGQIVGESQITGGGPYDYHAFLWESGVMYDLNDFIPASSGWVLREAADINDRGQIVGKGLIGGQYHAFLLTPIPEPSAMGVLALALVVAAGRLRRGT